MFDNLPSFNEVLQSFEDPQRMHAIVVHLPIALTLLGFVLTLGVTLTGSKVSGLRWTTVFVLLLATLSALWASATGEDAEHHLPIKPTGIAAEVLVKHEALAQWFWVSVAATGFFVLLSAVRVTWFRSVALVFALLASIVSVGWVAAIGHHGGEMVYRHSVGVPSAGTEHDHDDDKRDDKDKYKDADKDKYKTDTPPVKDKDKDVETPVKDKEVDPPVKDKALDDRKKGNEKDDSERKLPEVEPKDKTIFDP